MRVRYLIGGLLFGNQNLYTGILSYQYVIGGLKSSKGQSIFLYLFWHGSVSHLFAYTLSLYIARICLDNHTAGNGWPQMLVILPMTSNSSPVLLKFLLDCLLDRTSLLDTGWINLYLNNLKVDCVVMSGMNTLWSPGLILKDSMVKFAISASFVFQPESIGITP